MPWYKKPSEYFCDTCKTLFHNRVALPGGAGQPSSIVRTFGANNAITRCTPCAAALNGVFLSPVNRLGVRLSTTITYQIHGHGNFNFHGAPTLAATMAGATQPAMMASGALNLMQHPDSVPGMIRPPGAYSGANLGNAALRAWPGADGMDMHHVHIGPNGATRVLFGWSCTPYPNNLLYVQSVKLYIGSL